VAPPAPTCPPELVAAAIAQVRAHFHENHPGPGSFPGNAARIIDAIQQKEPDFNKLVKIVGQDPAIAAQLLKVANSPLYGGTTINDVRAAALRMGLKEVGEIALGVAGRTLFESGARAQNALFRERWDRLYHQSMTAAFAAGTLSVTASVGQPDRAFLAGMLHDIGRTMALRAIAVLQLAGDLDAVVFTTGIDAVLDEAHVELGASMATVWALPEYLRLAVAHHHDVDVPPTGELLELHLVRVTDGISVVHAGTASDETRACSAASASALRISDAKLRVAQAEYGDLCEKVTSVFNIPSPRR
jgi:HD-like signal output (HDOD) protein